MTAYGYVRVPAAGQNEDRQLDTMAALNIQPAHIFTGKQSGEHRDCHLILRRTSSTVGDEAGINAIIERAVTCHHI